MNWIRKFQWVVWGMLLLAAPIEAVLAAEATTPPPDYRIAPEDVLSISVWKEEGLEREVTVRPDGGISFPLAGDVPVAGKTPAEVEREITTRLQRYIPDAVVTVSVVKLEGLRIYVTGQVKNPGQFTVGRYVDVLQAITLAGGLTPFANEGKIKIMRRVNGREQTFDFNYGEVQRGHNLSQNMMLQADDVVVVP
jgi:polysaccharide export outer membrane protein